MLRGVTKSPHIQGKIVACASRIGVPKSRIGLYQNVKSIRFCKIASAIGPAITSRGTEISRRCCASMNTSGMKMIDIGANLTDDVFKGAYHGKQAHEGDLDAVLRRASAAGVHKIVVTAGQLPEVKEALELVHAADPGGERLFLTVGVHPTRCGEFEKSGDAQAYLDELMALAKEGAASGRVVAIGECGLDYDRLHFCDALTQKKYFELQFQLAEATGLPMFLHMRAAAADFVEILERNRSKFSAGVVHSFTGSKEELDRLLRLDGIYIGINGCSLKTEENLDVMAAIPLDRMMLETDAPWCEVKATHAGFKYVKTKWETRKKEKHSLECCVKNRCEPCHMQQVLEVVAGHRGIEDLDELSTTLYDTTCKVFFPQEA